MRKKSSVLQASSKAIDPTLDALFASSSGPVQAPSTSRYSALLEPKAREAPESAAETENSEDDDAAEDDEESSETGEELDYDDDEDVEDQSSSNEDSGGEECEDENDEDVVEKEGDIAMAEVEDRASGAGEVGNRPRRERKRKRKDDDDDLEAKYMVNLTKGDREEPPDKRRKADEENDAGEDDVIPVHETVAQESTDSDLEKASRTVFLANVSTEAISSKAAKKTLIAHLSSALDPHDLPTQKMESIRFRSVAFSTGSMPKRAAYITKSLMGATTKSTNAYAVFSTPAAARLVASRLNGTEVLGRHIRVDNVAHPSPTDHRRCIFVGNLGFVDDETVVSTNEDGEKVEKKRTKLPSDVEEGLWRTFSKTGKVENVRVVRDSKTRVGKGFAYVQFYDANDVEAALLSDGKAYPPMLPRKLRVTRAKDPRKTARTQERAQAKAVAAHSKARNTKYTPKMTPEQQAAAGRVNRLLGRAGAFLHRKKSGSSGANGTSKQKVVFEGNRASSKDGRHKDLKLGRRGKGRPKSRAASRAAQW
ncbi:nucleolar protein 12 [Metarhizium album ARSEF 1941]|uniref:Nucleolar protein 12 n=1 Tax=Metarhizium album (strain ARSEF 1941) TaxID=1081103 RepID=A0A0B2WVI5_METAS|nr:nucleolar protein 12 [Metarhizium album ARSEF 1941]KHO00132.1 nucleolar protein 12 [Metarhizium album ARSEF 1941]